MSRATLPIVLTLLLVAVTLPHSAEDFRYGEFARYGVSTMFAATGLVIVYAVQIAGIFLASRGHGSGYWMLAAAGLVWCIGASTVHGAELLASGPYRSGLASKALVVAIIALGGAIAVVSSRGSGRGLSRPPR